MTSKFRLLFVLTVLLLFAATSHAVLFRTGPSDVPSPPGNGFPLWYQDTAGLVLDLCLPANQAQLDAGICLILPPDQDPVEGINLPLVFPTNFPEESFWWNAGALIDLPGGNRAVLVLGLEATFNGGVPAVNDQISFGRIRIVVDAPVDGNYTVTHPYGVKEFPDVIAGKRAIAFTDDIGIGTPGDFSGALQSGIGPFLVAADAPGGSPLPLVTIGGDQFLSDTLLPEFVTGSPTGNNFFEVCTDNSLGLDGAGGSQCATIDQFSLMGKVHQGAIGSPLKIDSATYSRDATSAQVDVFATAIPGPGAANPVLSVGDAAGTAMSSVLMAGPTTLGQYYGQGLPPAADTLPAAVIVTNSADNPPSSVTGNLVDEVTIIQAVYNPAGTGTLTIRATSSDKLLPPQLFAIGLPGSGTGSDALLPVGGTDPPEQQLAAFPVGAVPPATVTVISDAGGQDTEAVVTIQGPAFPTGGPVAVDDNVSVEAGTTPVVIDVLFNDVGFDVTTVQILSGPANGTAVDSGTGIVTYTPTNTAFVGDDTFTYTVRTAPGGLESNVATVTVTTTAPTGGAAPIASPDGPFTVEVGATLTIPVTDLLANDSPNGGIIDPTSFAIVSVTGGVATVTAGVVDYVAGPSDGTFGFEYTVANTSGPPSAAALVTVSVVQAETVTVTRAEFKQNAGEWRVEGTSSIPGPNTITIFLQPNGGGTELGTAVVDGLGNWEFREKQSTTSDEGTTISVVSSFGTTINATLTIR